MPISRFQQIAAGAVLALSVSTSPGFAESAKTPDVLFVSTAQGLGFDGDRVVFSGVSPDIIWFTDRPERQSGQITPQQFVEAWNAGADSFGDDPPNAVLTLEGQIGMPVIVELSNPKLDGTTVTYNVSVLRGSLPAKAGETSIVFDQSLGGVVKASW